MDQLLWGKIDDVAPHLPLSGYLFYAVVGALYFILQHFIIHLFVRVLYPGYNKMNRHDFHDYRMQINAFIHATLATGFAIYCLYFTCGDGKTFFNDQQCRLYPRNSHVYTCFFTASYLFVETCFIVFYVGTHSAIDRQTLLHHVIAFANYYAAFWQQDFTVTVGAAFIFLEVSTPFVCLRWLLFHHGYKGSILQNINTVFLFVFFIFGRVFVQIYLIWFYQIDWLADMWFEKEGVPTLYKVILAEMATAVLINVVLNFYWSFLIMRQLYRVIFKGPDADKNFSGLEESKEEGGNNNTTLDGNNLEAVSKKKQTQLEMKQMLESQQLQSDEPPV